MQLWLFVCVCLYASSASHQLVWVCSVCLFICLVKHSKTLFQLKGGLECLSPGKSGNSSSGEVGIQPEECQVLPKKASAKYEKGVRFIKEKSSGKPCATSVSVHYLCRKTELLTRQGSGEAEVSVLIHNKQWGSQSWVFCLQPTAVKNPSFLTCLCCILVAHGVQLKLILSELTGSQT